MSDNLGDVVIPEELAAVVAANPGVQVTEVWDPVQEKLTWAVLGSGAPSGAGALTHVNADYTFDIAEDETLVVDATAGDIVITLPDAPDGKLCRIIRGDSTDNLVTVTPVGVMGLEDSPSNIRPNYTFEFVADQTGSSPTGSSWFITSITNYYTQEGSASLIWDAAGDSNFTEWDTNNPEHIVILASGVVDTTLTLPPAGNSVPNVPRGVIIEIKNKTAHVITIATNGTAKIDGSDTFVLSTQYESVTLMCDGTDWWVL